MTLPTTIADGDVGHPEQHNLIDDAIKDPSWQLSHVERGFAVSSTESVTTATNALVPGILLGFRWGDRPIVVRWGGQLSHDTPNKNAQLWFRHLAVDVCRAGRWVESTSGLYTCAGYLRFGPAPGFDGTIELKLVNFDGGGNVTLLPGAYVSLVEV